MSGLNKMLGFAPLCTVPLCSMGAVPVILTASEATLNLSGQPTLFNVTFITDAGQILVAGQAAVLDRSMPGSEATINLQGQDTVFPIVFTASEANLSFAGQTIVANVSLNADRAILTLQGIPALVALSMLAEGAVFEIEGEEAGLSVLIPPTVRRPLYLAGSGATYWRGRALQSGEAAQETVAAEAGSPIGRVTVNDNRRITVDEFIRIVVETE